MTGLRELIELEKILNFFKIVFCHLNLATMKPGFIERLKVNMSMWDIGANNFP